MSESSDNERRLEKLKAKLGDEWEELDSLSAEALERKVVEATDGLLDNQRIKEEDDDLDDAVAKAKRLGLPYREAAKRLTAVAQYCTLRLKELGR